MQVTKGTWRMREQCVPGSLSSSPAREPGNEANKPHEFNDPLALLILNRTTGRYTPDSTVYKVLP